MFIPDTDEQRLIRESVSTITARFGHDYFIQQSRAGLNADELWFAISDAGFAGVHLPTEYGGGGLGITEMALVVEETSAQGCPLTMMIISPGIVGSIIAKFGSSEQKQHWLPRMISGHKRICFAITEPGAGSNSHNIKTNATRDGEGWILNGSKYFISGVDACDAILVVACTERDENTGRGKLSLFLVPTDSPGLTKHYIPTEMHAPERQYTLFFDDIKLGPESVVGEVNKGLQNVFTGLNPERITGASMGVGIGRYALSKATAYARDRQVWDVPIGSHQGIAHPLADAYMQIELARLMNWRAAQLFDNGEDAGEAANIAKYASAEAAIYTLDRAIQTHGGNGISSEYGLADMWFLTRLLRTAPISKEMILNFIAQHSLDLPKSY